LKAKKKKGWDFGTTRDRIAAEIMGKKEQGQWHQRQTKMPGTRGRPGQGKRKKRPTKIIASKELSASEWANKGGSEEQKGSGKKKPSTSVVNGPEGTSGRIISS